MTADATQPIYRFSANANTIGWLRAGVECSLEPLLQLNVYVAGLGQGDAMCAVAAERCGGRQTFRGFDVREAQAEIDAKNRAIGLIPIRVMRQEFFSPF